MFRHDGLMYDHGGLLDTMLINYYLNLDAILQKFNLDLMFD